MFYCDFVAVVDLERERFDCVAYGMPFPPKVRALRLSKIDLQIDHVLDFWSKIDL